MMMSYLLDTSEAQTTEGEKRGRKLPEYRRFALNKQQPMRLLAKPELVHSGHGLYACEPHTGGRCYCHWCTIGKDKGTDSRIRRDRDTVCRVNAAHLGAISLVGFQTIVFLVCVSAKSC